MLKKCKAEKRKYTQVMAASELYKPELDCMFKSW